MKIFWTHCLLLLFACSALGAASSDDDARPNTLRWGLTSSTTSYSQKHRLGNATSTPTLSPAPSIAPSSNSSSAPTTHGNETVSPAPTISPAPTVSPAPTIPNATLSPAPSLAPTHHNETVSPAPSIAPTASNDTVKPTEAPTTGAPTESPHHHHHHIHVWKILCKTIAWMIVAGLSVLAFGSCMSNRYRIYYYMRGTWYSFLRLRCTQSVLMVLRLDGWVFGRRSTDTSLNEIIFDGNNDLHEGLLMRETIG